MTAVDDLITQARYFIDRRGGRNSGFDVNSAELLSALVAALETATAQAAHWKGRWEAALNVGDIEFASSLRRAAELGEAQRTITAITADLAAARAYAADVEEDAQGFVAELDARERTITAIRGVVAYEAPLPADTDDYYDTPFEDGWITCANAVLALLAPTPSSNE